MNMNLLVLTAEVRSLQSVMGQESLSRSVLVDTNWISLSASSAASLPLSAIWKPSLIFQSQQALQAAQMFFYI